jgi:hypothetical protein
VIIRHVVWLTLRVALEVQYKNTVHGVFVGEAPQIELLGKKNPRLCNIKKK